MQNLISLSGLVIAAAAVFGGSLSVPVAPAAASLVNLDLLAPAPQPSTRIRGEWVRTGARRLDGFAPADSVRPTGTKLGEGLTFTGSAALKIYTQSDAVYGFALYAEERPGLAFVVSRKIDGLGLSVVIPDAPQQASLPADDRLRLLCPSCVSRS